MIKIVVRARPGDPDGSALLRVGEFPVQIVECGHFCQFPKSSRQCCECGPAQEPCGVVTGKLKHYDWADYWLGIKKSTTVERQTTNLIQQVFKPSPLYSNLIKSSRSDAV